jgi:hypothetical protein
MVPNFIALDLLNPELIECKVFQMRIQSDINSAADRIRTLKGKIMANPHLRCFWNVCDLLSAEQHVPRELFTDLVEMFNAKNLLKSESGYFGRYHSR